MDIQKNDITHILLGCFMITIIPLLGGMVAGYLMMNDKPTTEKCVRDGDVNNEYFRKPCDWR